MLWRKRKILFFSFLLFSQLVSFFIWTSTFFRISHCCAVVESEYKSQSFIVSTIYICKEETLIRVSHFFFIINKKNVYVRISRTLFTTFIIMNLKITDFSSRRRRMVYRENVNCIFLLQQKNILHNFLITGLKFSKKKGVKVSCRKN